MRTLLLRFLLCLLALLTGTGAYAGESTDKDRYFQLTMEVDLDRNIPNLEPGLAWDLSEAKNTWCERTIFTNSSHPGSNPYQRFNENNGGLAFKCAKSRDSMFYTVGGGVHDSRDGTAVFLGKGIQFQTPLRFGPYIGVGAELSLVHYSYDDSLGYGRVLKNAPPALIAKLGRLPQAERGYLIFPLPILVSRVGYAWENQYLVGHVSFVSRNLAGAAHLRGIEIAIKVRRDFF